MVHRMECVLNYWLSGIGAIKAQRYPEVECALVEWAGLVRISSDFRHVEDGGLHAVGDAMDYDKARDATAEHAGRGDKCYAKPAGGVEPPMPMEDGDDVPAQVSEGCPLPEFAVDAGDHGHLDQATANCTRKASYTTNYGK